MKHIKESNDWLYEFRPHIIIGVATVGVLARVFTTTPPEWASLNILCSLVLFAAGAYILSMRKDYRKTNHWMK